MASKLLKPIITQTRAGLRTVAKKSPIARRIMARTAQEVWSALDDDVYGSAYFGAGRNPLDRMGLSGYERYDRDTSNANAAAYIIWRFLQPKTSLDVGCATGFVVEALAELGVDSKGCDLSQYAIENAALGARGRLFYGDLTDKVHAKDKQFDVVSALETFEHLPNESIEGAIKEIKRLTRKYVMVTTPSFGPNENGPGGWFDVKVKPERLDYYKSLPDDYEGPVPFDDLYRDAKGEPIEGHLTIASFSWWTKQFAAQGFIRCADTERRIHPHLARFGLTKYWNLYIFRLPEVEEPKDNLVSEHDALDVEKRFGLDTKKALPEDVESVKRALAAKK